MVVLRVAAGSAVKLLPGQFGEGGLRTVQRLRMDFGDGRWEELVAKTFKFECADRVTSAKEWFYREVESQVVAAALADAFNDRRPPKPIAFIMPFVIELLHRDGRPLYNVEPLLEGAYEKHNDNSGGVYQSAQLHFQRNTPQAFSHFTWEASGKRCVVCDIQGVADLYTDPQVHTVDGKGFGQGNCGRQGIHKFLGTHRCNEICQYLGLSPIRMESLPVTLMWPIGYVDGQEIDFEGPDNRPQKLRLPQQDPMRALGPGQPFQAIVEVICSADRAGEPTAAHQARAQAERQHPLPRSIIDAQGRFDRGTYALVAVLKHPTCPHGCRPGQQFKFSTPDGGSHWCVVPPGCKPGKRFGVVLPIAVPKEYIRLHARSKAEIPFVAKRYWKEVATQQVPAQQVQQVQGTAPPGNGDVAAGIAGGGDLETLATNNLPPGWERRKTADGKVYYANHSAQTTQWEPPR